MPKRLRLKNTTLEELLEERSIAQTPANLNDQERDELLRFGQPIVISPSDLLDRIQPAVEAMRFLR